jgi:hypothetical protein
MMGVEGRFDLDGFKPSSFLPFRSCFRRASRGGGAPQAIATSPAGNP